MKRSGLKRFRRTRFAVAAAAVVAASMFVLTAAAQNQYGLRGKRVAVAPSGPTIECPTPAVVDLPKIPELVAVDHVLNGTINLIDVQQRVPTSVTTATPPPQPTVNCQPQFVRNFRGADAKPPMPNEPPKSDYPDPQPGPTLRASVGDIVQLMLVNTVNSNNFDANIDREACTAVSPSGQGTAAPYPGYPGTDKYPNCLHATSTANLHFHGIHSSPTSTADNIFVQVRPLPRKIDGTLAVSPDQITAPLYAKVNGKNFFDNCADRLRNNPLNQWPTLWSALPAAWTGYKQDLSKYPYSQQALLTAYDNGTAPYRQPITDPAQKLWPQDQKQIDGNGWPQYYVGAFPYCFVLPRYQGSSWPPAQGLPIMGQSPGTHWYHAHKHGATAINVANGMVGAFIIEGRYDQDIDDAYKGYVVTKNDKQQPWSMRDQPVIVLNQIYVQPPLMAGLANVDFTVNGRLRPIVHMQPGEVQVWRIVNGSGRSAAYVMPPPANSLQWRQLANDGVQLADSNYQASANQPFFMASGNRVDLLVQAPALAAGQTAAIPVQIQNVVARSALNNPNAPTANPLSTLFTVEVAGPPVTRNGQAATMPLLAKAPDLPPFLTNITDADIGDPTKFAQTLNFETKKGTSPGFNHFINNQQFGDIGDGFNITVSPNTAQQWLVKNSTPNTSTKGPPTIGPVDHPFHIHVNPFQVTEVFDPNEFLPADDGTPGGTPRYVLSFTPPAAGALLQGQCWVNPDDETTWRNCNLSPSNPVWRDTFAIPAGLGTTNSKGSNIIIPGYFKMRSRFVDYTGEYVLHCHILAHEDRGMMFTVAVTDTAHQAHRMQHH